MKTKKNNCPSKNQSCQKRTSGLCCGSVGAVLLATVPLKTVAVVVVDLDTVLLHQLHYLAL